jgi:NADH-quinone oxidoreductase subunit F
LTPHRFSLIVSRPIWSEVRFLVMQEPRIMKDFGPRPWEITPYLKQGGYEAWKACLAKWTREQIIAEIKKAGMRGRGGAGFPTGIKWEKVLNHRIPEHYFVCNAGEHEPGTFKDRHLLKTNPHQLLEGMLIAAHTVKAKAAYIYVNHEYVEEIANLRKAADEARAQGFMGKNVLGKGFDLDVEFVEGQGSYVAGEETAMLESMQGRPAMPRQKPPFYPTDFGLYGKPTLVNNVETLCNIPPLLRNGAAWFAQVGTEKSPGTMLFSLSGAVNKPGVYELPMGTTIRTLIEECGGGVPGGRKVKAVFPGGPSFSMLTPDQLDTPMDFESLKHAGTGLGSAGVIVVDDQTCMVATALKYTDFFKVESCGQCPPCRMGTINLAALLQKIEDGEGTEKDLASLLQLCGFVKGRGYCTVVTGASVIGESTLRLFRREFDEHIAQKRCPFEPVAVAGGVA